MKRVHNFNAGPAALPLEALQKAQAEFLDFDGTGMSIMEHSHRGKDYERVHFEALGLIRSLLAVPDTHDVVLMQGGATAQFAFVPMNFLPVNKHAEYITTGTWSEKALSEAGYIGKVTEIANTKEGNFTTVPKQAELKISNDAAYVHLTSNETIHGVQFHQFPDTGNVPLVADMSSDILSRPLDISRFGLIYAGAQKNMGPSGVTVVIVRKDWAAKGRTDVPQIFRYSAHAKADSLLNTCPTFAIYMLRNTLQWVAAQGGAIAMQTAAKAKSDKIYAVIDQNPKKFTCPVAKDARSHINVVFRLPTEADEAAFVEEAKKRQIVGIKGHRSVGGIRASIYNAVPMSAVDALAELMLEFTKRA